MAKKKCLIGLHSYEVLKELEVKDNKNDVVVGINIVSRCKECGKIKATFVGTDSNFLEKEYVVINNNNKK